MYIVIGQETHPDRFLAERAYGPFKTFEEADAFSVRKTHASENKSNTYSSSIYTYYVVQLFFE